MGEMEAYGEVTREVAQHSQKASDSASLAKAYSYLADYFSYNYVSDSAYSYNDKAEKIYRHLSDEKNVCQSLLNKAIIQHNESDYLGSERNVFKLLKILKKYSDDEMIYQANNLLGIIYGELAEFQLSANYYNKALQMAKRNSIPKDHQSVANTYNNIGVLYTNMKEYSRAQENFTLGLKQKNVTTDTPILTAKLTDNLGYVYLKTNNFEDARALFYNSLKIRDSLKLKPAIGLSKLHLAEYYAAIGTRDSAKLLIQEAYELAKANREKRDLLPILKKMASLEPAKALRYSELYYKISDSLQLAERKVRNKLARVEYETDELAQQKEQLVEQRKILISVAFAIILIATLVFVIRIQIAKNRELKLVQEQQKANEEIFHLMISQQDKVEEERQKEKKRIAQELHDGVLGKLFGTRMNLGILNDRRHDEQTVVQRGAFIDDLKTIEQELREISHDLSREHQAVYNNFVLMVGNFIESQRSVCTATIKYTMDRKIAWGEVPNNTKINLYRILQEAFQNINKHAAATAVDVKFIQSEEAITLLVSDNGVGFNYSKKRNGIGLQNMQSRITDSRGTMVVTTATGEGTSLEFKISSHLAFI